jgi:Spy/CpxP family protein refolding chaperone
VFLRLRRAAGRGVAALCLVSCTPTAIDSARWWHSPQFVAALRLSPPQIRAIDDIYSNMLPERMARAAKAEAAAAALDRLLDADTAEVEVEAAAQEAADADAARRRLRTLMLYRIARVLSVEQRHQFTALVRTDAPL